MVANQCMRQKTARCSIMDWISVFTSLERQFATGMMDRPYSLVVTPRTRAHRDTVSMRLCWMCFSALVEIPPSDGSFCSRPRIFFTVAGLVNTDCDNSRYAICSARSTAAASAESTSTCFSAEKITASNCSR